MTTHTAALAFALALCTVASTAFSLDPPPPAKPVIVTGKSESGLQTRLIAESASFKAGHPIPIRVEIANTGQKPASYTKTSLAHSQSFAVTDADGKPVPFLAGPAGVMARQKFVDPGQTEDVELLDLSKWFYLRRPGRYAVSIPTSSVMPATEKLHFEVTPDPAGTADGDPIGRLLPLVEKRGRWILVARTNDPGKIRPGLNRAEVPGRVIIFQHHPEGGTKLDTKLIWFWLCDEPSAEAPPAAHVKWPPPTDALGSVGRWHVYAHVPDAATKLWPTVIDDVKKALEAEKR